MKNKKHEETSEVMNEEKTKEQEHLDKLNEAYNKIEGDK